MKEALDSALRQLHRTYGREVCAPGGVGGEVGLRAERLPTGVPGLDPLLGGGWPRGRVVELFGPEASGKTTLLLLACASAQRAGRRAAFIDAEHRLDPAYAKALGVDLSQLLVCQPDNGEQALDIAEALARSGAVSVVAVDSVAALVPQSEIEGSMADPAEGLIARLMSKAMRKIVGVAAKNQVLLLFSNQLRLVEGFTFGPSEKTEGGNALKYYASVRVDLRRIGGFKERGGERTAGDVLRAKVVKNSLGVPFNQVEFRLRHGVGTEAAPEGGEA